jgi:lipopolysaccharide export LptBFGC system permease protein LptF
LSNARTLTAESYPLSLDLKKQMRKGHFTRKPASLSLNELGRAIRNVRRTFPDLQENGVPRMRIKLAVEASKRLALALSCFSFALLGIPLGIRAHHKESSIGIGLSLVLLFVYYLFIILADSLLDHPAWRPDLIPWIPVLGGQLLGGFLLYRNR